MEKKLPEDQKGSEPEGKNGWTGPVDSPERVAQRIVACAKRPRPVVLFMPLGRIGLAGTDLFPGIWRFLARRYIAIRTKGHGVPHP
jgi:hypothetical protein